MKKEGLEFIVKKTEQKNRMKSLQGLLLALIVVLVLVVTALCGDHDHSGRHQKGGHRFHSHHKHHAEGAVKLHLQESGTAKNETVVIDVARSQTGVDGSQSKLRVRSIQYKDCCRSWSNPRACLR